MTAPITLTEALTITKDVTIDLNGKTITGKAGEHAILVTGGNVTLTGNGTVSAERSAVFATAGSVVIENGTYKSTGTYNSADVKAAIVAKGTGSVTINGGNFTSTDLAINMNDDATVVIKGGTFHSTATRRPLINNCCDTNLVIEGGTFTSACGYIFVGVAHKGCPNNSAGTAVIKGGTFTEKVDEAELDTLYSVTGYDNASGTTHTYTTGEDGSRTYTFVTE